MKKIWLIAAATLVVASSTATAGMLTGFDAMTSTVMQEEQSSFSGIALRARLQPATLIKQIEILPTVEYWRNSSTVNPYDIRSTRKDATLAVDARYHFANETWKPYLGVGYGIHFLSSQVSAPAFGIPNGSDGVVKGGLAALGGVSFGMTSRIDNFFELKYHHIPEYRQLKINWGLSYRL